MIFNVVIGYVVANMLDVNLVANGTIVNAGIVNTTIFHYSTIEGHSSRVIANSNVSRELHIPNIFRNEIRVYLYLLPVIGITSLLLKF